jgi:hypothetical protein
MRTPNDDQPPDTRPIYNSPRSKLLSFFRKSRNQWKEKCLVAKRLVKKLKNRVRFLEQSKEHWKGRVRELKRDCALLAEKTEQLQAQALVTGKKLASLAESTAEDIPIADADTSFADRLPRHRYSWGHVRLFAALVFSAATSLRSASRVIEVIRVLLQVPLISPSWQTGRLWLLRLGYYKLTRAKKQANDWVWIVDHTIQLGPEKCLVILGLRLRSFLALGRCLRHEDVEPIAIVPMKKSHGEAVCEQLEASSKKTGIPREIVGDRGPDLKAGVEQFCRKHPETCSIYDVKHQTAVVLKQELTRDVTWRVFARLANETKKRVQQTILAHLAPPRQKAKSRYMNLGRLLRWGKRLLAFLRRNSRAGSERVDQEYLEDKLGWVKAYRLRLREWGELLQLVETTEKFVRERGFYRQCPRDLKRMLTPLVSTKRGARVCQRLLAYAKEESRKAKPRERLLGSSEVIESVFGKWKRLEGEQAHSGFTGLLLSIGAMVAPTTAETVQQALKTVSTEEVLDWSRQQLGPTIQAKRKQAFPHQSE